MKNRRLFLLSPLAAAAGLFVKEDPPEEACSTEQLQRLLDELRAQQSDLAREVARELWDSEVCDITSINIAGDITVKTL